MPIFPRILLIGLLFSLLPLGLCAQKFYTRTGHVWFKSSTPIEDIEAHNNQASCLLNTETGELAVNLLVKSFKFPIALMQEHFNENYIESDKFPKSSFEGTVTGFDPKKKGKQEVKVAGKLTLHGVTQPLTTTATIETEGAGYRCKANFRILLADYKVLIPKTVEDKIEKSITLQVDMLLEPLKR